MPEHIDVFLSSTSRDLADYRAAVAKVIADMNLFTIGMENFQPTEDNPVQVCYDQVQDAELFVGIYAYRYGYIPAAGMAYTGGATDGATGITHMEYQWALAKRIPIMLFVVDDKLDWDGPRDDDLNKLDDFKAQIMRDHVVGFFTTPDNLAAKAATALHAALKRKFPRETPGWNRPATPTPSPYFAGRAAEINAIQRMLDHPGARVVVQGMGGYGKTALAKYMADRLGRDYPGGTLWAELGPNLTDPGAVRSQVYERWKHATPEGASAQPADLTPDNMRAWLSRAPGRMLAVIDDVWHGEALRPLLDVLPPNTDVIITTRDAGVYPMGQRFELTHLTPPDALRMLKLHLSLESDDAHDADLATIAELLGYHALALDITAAKLSSTSAHDAAKLIRRLEKHRAGDNPFKELKLGSVRDDNLEAALALSYEPLSETQQAHFRLLGAVPHGLDFARRMALAVWGVDPDDEDAVEDAEDALDALARVGLAGRARNGRYALHNLLTDYARALMRRAEEDEEAPARARYEAEVIRITKQMDSIERGGIPLERWDAEIGPDYPHVEQYGDDLVAAFAAWWEDGHLNPLRPFGAPATGTAKLSTAEGNFGTLKAPHPGEEQKSPPSEFGGSGEGGNLSPTAGTPYMASGGGNIDWAALPGTVPALKTLAAPDAPAPTDADAIRETLSKALDFVFRSGGGNYVHFRQIDERGLDWLRLGLLGARVLEDQRGASYCLNQIALWLDNRGHKYPALAYYEAKLPINRSTGDQTSEATTLNNIGAVYLSLGDKQKALAYFEQALPIQRAVGDRSGEATTLNNIGAVYGSLGDNAQALAYYEQALPIQRAVGDRSGEAVTLFNMSFLVNDISQAIDMVQQAHDLWIAIRSPHAQQHAAPRLAQLKAQRDGGG